MIVHNHWSDIFHPNSYSIEQISLTMVAISFTYVSLTQAFIGNNFAQYLAMLFSGSTSSWAICEVDKAKSVLYLTHKVLALII